jgi:hypothetical protein
MRFSTNLVVLVPLIIMIYWTVQRAGLVIRWEWDGVEYSTRRKIPIKAGDQIIVTGRTQREDTDWIPRLLPEWQHVIYEVDNATSPMSLTVNKGREANVYLTYIIDHYHKLPSTIAFIHPHENGSVGAWHTDAVENSNVHSLRALNVEFVQKNGYANMRCNPEPGCPSQVIGITERPLPAELNREVQDGYHKAWPLVFNNHDVPPIVATPCCAQFAVSREQVLKRSQAEYVRMRHFLMITENDDDGSGRIFEYMWHIIFGQDPV